MNPFAFTGIGALIAAGVGAAKQNTLNKQKTAANGNGNGNGNGNVAAEIAKIYTGSDIVEFNKIQSGIDEYIKTTYGNKNPVFDAQIVLEKNQILNFAVTKENLKLGGASYENFVFDPYTTDHANINSSYPHQVYVPPTPLTKAQIIQNGIFDFIKPFANNDLGELWRLIDNFYRPTGGDEKTILDHADGQACLAGTKQRLFEYIRNKNGFDNPTQTYSNYDYPKLKEIIEAWQKKEKGIIGQIWDWTKDHSKEILDYIETHYFK